jgi:DNA-directed RNA polymerase specialized sigma24 family protein
MLARKWSRMTPEYRAAFTAECVRLYVEDRLPVRAIARATGRSYGAVHTALATAEVAMRPQGRGAACGS